MVATKELFQEALPLIDCFDYSWSIVSDPQKAEQIENNLSAIISSNPDLELDTIGIHKDYEEMENRVVFGGFQALSWLVFLFGVVNLINTTLSNQNKQTHLQEGEGIWHNHSIESHFTEFSRS